MRAVRGSGCTVVPAADGAWVEKRYDRLSWWFLDHRHDKFERERRVGMLLRRQPPPVRFARLLDADRRRRRLYFEAVEGEPLGPKYPYSLSSGDLDALLGVASAMAAYTPRARFAARFDLARRLHRAVRDRLITGQDAEALRAQAASDPPVLVFGHGDITARNVLRAANGDAVLIDWEWAGLYPRGWDLAFLWVTVVDTPGARERVERAVPARDRAWFWRSALLIQLLHLSLPGLAVGTPFRPNHERTRDRLLELVV